MTAVDDHVPDVYLTRDELAARIKFEVNTLAHWAARGEGPTCRKFGGRVRYKLADVEAWEAEQPTGGAA